MSIDQHQFKRLSLLIDGSVKQGNTEIAQINNRLQAVEDMEEMLVKLNCELWTELRLLEKTSTGRLTIEDHSWGVHMTHCFQGDEEHGNPYSCKYGEDDICPAATHKDPYGYFQAHEDEWKEKRKQPG
jgi:hypothetical protein